MNEEETQKQFEYMKKTAELLKGRKVRYHSICFGCQMNEKDSEKLSGILEQMGCESTDSEAEADIIIYNTCTVRENADKRLYGRLGVAKQYKEARPDMLICLCGCMMQEPGVVEKIQKSYGYVDIIFGTHNIFKFAELLYNRITSGSQIIDIWKDTSSIVEDLPSKRRYSFKSGVNIMYGCNNFCSYCIVPYVRGRERSRDPHDIIREIEGLAADGVVEVMLLGQNVNSYGRGLDRDIDFAGLLREAAQIDGIGRIRFMTSHPKDLSDELITTIRDIPKIARHIHLPLQSGSDRILASMNRHYTRQQYIDLAQKIRSEIPDVSITTDIIAGYPGETAADVDDTIDVIEQVRFDGAFTFEYSRRTGTPAAALPDQVEPAVMQEGFDRILSKVQEISKEQAQRFEGRVAEVLVENENEKDPSMYTGRISQNNVVHFKKQNAKIGSFVQISLDECHGFYYTGSIH